MLRNTTFALFAALIATAANAAPIVAFIESEQTRTQAQGNGTYRVIDVNYSSGGTAEFTNYRIIATATTGSLFDPAKLQDSRQTNSADVSNTKGAVDTYADTVMTASAGEDLGLTPTITPNGLSYNPAGSGAAAPFTLLDWSVFDQQDGDDNNLNDLPAAQNGPVAAVAPYRIARILTSAGSQGVGTIVVQAFDTTSAGVPSTFTFAYGVPEPATMSLLGLALVGGLGFLRRR